ncbi:MAG: HPF/RaiA family ribosome-associated protein [Flavobacteriaceae bacterium]|nr:HPF/RaiA family ribosome-associated protein [Flavobacteriaceae bacterium]
MKVNVQSVNFNADSKLIDFLNKKLENLTKFSDKVIGASVFLKVQKTSDKENKVTEMIINLPGKEFVVKKQEKSFEEGIQLAVKSLARKLKATKREPRLI